MKTVKLIEDVLNTDLFDKDFLVLPNAGASNSSIEREELNLSRKLSTQHKEILKKWNGANLDIIRLYGCSPVNDELFSLSDRQLDIPLCNNCYIVFGDDPAGFLFIEDYVGEIFSYDTKGGTVKLIAKDLEDFFGRLIFGVDAENFAGSEWKEELINCGLVE